MAVANRETTIGNKTTYNKMSPSMGHGFHLPRSAWWMTVEAVVKNVWRAPGLGWLYYKKQCPFSQYSFKNIWQPIFHLRWRSVQGCQRRKWRVCWKKLFNKPGLIWLIAFNQNWHMPLLICLNHQEWFALQAPSFIKWSCLWYKMF